MCCSTRALLSVLSLPSCKDVRKPLRTSSIRSDFRLTRLCCVCLAHYRFQSHSAVPMSSSRVPRLLLRNSSILKLSELAKMCRCTEIVSVSVVKPHRPCRRGSYTYTHIHLSPLSNCLWHKRKYKFAIAQEGQP